MDKKRFYPAIVIFILFAWRLFCPVSGFAQDNREKDALYVAKKSFDDGFFDVSLTLFNRFLELFPASKLAAEADLYVGRCYFQQKRYNEAISRFKVLIGQGNSSVRDKAYYWLAEAYFKNNELGEAYNFYERLFSEYPGSSYAPEAFYSLGWCLFELGRFGEAKKKFAEFRDMFPHDTLVQEAEFKLAECLYNLKDYAGLKEYLLDREKKYAAGAISGPERYGYMQDTRAALLEFYLAESCFYLGDYACAVENYTRALGLSAETGLRDTIYLGLGWSYLKRFNPGLAAENFDNVLSAQSKGKIFEGALLGKAVALGMGRKFEQSLDCYAKLLKLSDDPLMVFESYLGKADVLYNMGDYSQAISVYKEARARVDDRTDRLLLDRIGYGLGQSYFKSRDLKSALEEFLSLADNSGDPGFKVSGLAKAADVYLESGDTLKSIAMHENILKDYPDCQVCDYVRSSLGKGLFEIKDYPRAIGVLKAAIARYPESGEGENMNFYLGTAYYESGDYLNAYLQLRGFINKYPLSAYLSRALIMEGLSLKSLRRFQDSYDVFKEVVKNYPLEAQLSSRAEFEMADCLYYSGRKDEALAKFEFLRSKYADSEASGLALWRLAGHYYEEGRMDLSRRYLSELLRNQKGKPLFDEANYMLGLCLEREGKAEEALDSFRKASGMGAKAYIKIADIYKSLDKYDEAVAAYRYALNEGGLNAEPARFSLAECLEEMGKTDEAISEYYGIRENKALMVKGVLRCARIFEERQDWDAASDAYGKIAELGVEESRFASERIELIKGQAGEKTRR